MGLFENPIEKKIYEVDYKKMKEEGAPFHPFATWKDMVVALFLLLLLLALTIVYGVHLDAPADPTSQYLPRPEWYFMFLFQLLKYFPGWTAIFAVAIIPGVAAAALLLLPFYDWNPYRTARRRPLAVAAMSVSMGIVVGLTLISYWQDAHDPHVQALLAGAAASHGAGAPHAAAGTADGEAIYTANCVMCHGQSGTQIPNVALKDKTFIDARDVKMIVTNGKIDKGMPSFKDKLKPEEIETVAKWLKDNAK